MSWASSSVHRAVTTCNGRALLLGDFQLFKDHLLLLGTDHGSDGGSFLGSITDLQFSDLLQYGLLEVIGNAILDVDALGAYADLSTVAEGVEHGEISC